MNVPASRRLLPRWLGGRSGMEPDGQRGGLGVAARTFTWTTGTVQVNFLVDRYAERHLALNKL